MKKEPNASNRPSAKKTTVSDPILDMVTGGCGGMTQVDPPSGAL